MEGIKELYDITLRLNAPIEIEGRKYDTNEAILMIETAELCQINQGKVSTQATGGYNNNILIDWTTDKEMQFSLTHGVLSPISWSILSNSNIKDEKIKSVPFREYKNLIYDLDNSWIYCELKYIPNHCNCIIGAQPNPDFEKLPMGRREELMLKPLPPSRDKFIFCYDAETGKKIKDFTIIQNKIFFTKEYKKVYIDYTFNFEDKIKVIEVGNRLFNGFLNLTGKMSVKDEKSGEVTTAILEMPKIKLSSSLSMRLGKNYDYSTVSDFFFIGYPDDRLHRGKQETCRISFLDKELTGDYI